MTTPTLEQVLARREARQHRQREVIDERHMPLVSITVVSPGPVKLSPTIRRVFDEACDETLARLGEVERFPIWLAEEYVGATGPELLLAVDAHASLIKPALVDLEDRHAWGRLWDLDLIDEDGSPVPRTAVGAPPRRCLLCERPSPECARSRRHSVAELERAVADIAAREP